MFGHGLRRKSCWQFYWPSSLEKEWCQQINLADTHKTCQALQVRSSHKCKVANGSGKGPATTSRRVPKQRQYKELETKVKSFMGPKPTSLAGRNVSKSLDTHSFGQFPRLGLVLLRNEISQWEFGAKWCKNVRNQNSQKGSSCNACAWKALRPERTCCAVRRAPQNLLPLVATSPPHPLTVLKS